MLYRRPADCGPEDARGMRPQGAVEESCGRMSKRKAREVPGMLGHPWDNREAGGLRLRGLGRGVSQCVSYHIHLEGPLVPMKVIHGGSPKIRQLPTERTFPIWVQGQNGGPSFVVLCHAPAQPSQTTSRDRPPDKP